MKKRLLSILLAATLVLSMTACGSKSEDSTTGKESVPNETPASEKEETSSSGGNIDSTVLYGIGGGATGGTFNAMGNVFTQFFNDGEKYGQFSATATTGGVQNVMFMQNGTCDFGIVGQSVFVQAVDGTDAFAETGAYEDLKIIAPLYSAIFQQFVGSPDIKTEDDLRGKRLVVGGPGSGDVAILETLYGIMGMEFDKDFEAQYLGTNEGVEAMKDGHADGAMAQTQLPFGAFLELTNAEKAWLIPLKESTIEAMCDSGEHTYPSFFPSVIPANTYKTQPEDLPTFATGTYLCCRGDLSEELIYELTKYMWENIEDLHMLHAAVADLTIDSVKTIADMPIHPGALKYYQEQGVL